MSTSNDPFLFGFSASTGLDAEAAAAAWVEFSRDLSDRSRRALELFGYAEGFYQGQQYLKITMKEKGQK